MAATSSNETSQKKPVSLLETSHIYNTTKLQDLIKSAKILPSRIIKQGNRLYNRPTNSII